MTHLPNNIHLIGIGGDGMSALAGILLHSGRTISGSEQNDFVRVKQKEILNTLTEKGAKIFYGHSSNNITSNTELIVKTSIIPDDNPEIKEALLRGIPVIKRAEALGMLMRDKRGISVAGSAGKSTTSAMLSLLFLSAGYDPTVCIGARSAHLEGNNFYLGNGDHFIAEADEFDRSFLKLSQETAIISNIFFSDHLDYYETEEEMINAFGEFISHCQKVFIYGDDQHLLSLVKKTNVPYETFGIGESYDWSAQNAKYSPDKSSFELCGNSKSYGMVHIPITGKHNILNALSAIAAASHYDIDPVRSSMWIASYLGIKRRLERKEVKNGIIVYDDYGHNKRQIDSTLDAIRQMHPNKNIYAVFQPRQFRRTKILLDEITDAFSKCTNVILLDISKGIGDTEEHMKSIHSQDLVIKFREKNISAIYAESFENAGKILHEIISKDDVVVTFGTGNPFEVIQYI